MKSVLWTLTGALLVQCIAGAGLASAGPTSEDVRFQNGDTTLSGTIFFPSMTPPVAAVVLVHGAGEVSRMSPLARLLASDGIAVLTYDKRGVGESGGTYEGQDNVSAVNLALLARDAAAGLTALKQHPRLRDITTGYLGMSQAGWIIPIAAETAPLPSFMALWSGPACTVSEELHFSAWAENDPDFWTKHESPDVSEFMKSVRYRKDDVDPRASLSRISIPGLWLFGGKDNSIPVDLSIARLNGLIAQGHTIQYKVFPDQDHNLADSPGQESYRYMVAWIRSIASNAREAPAHR